MKTAGLVISIFSILLLSFSCSKKKSSDSETVVLTNTQKPVLCEGIDTYTPTTLTKHASSITIPYKITAKMYHSGSDTVVDTPSVIIEKIHKSFDLWESIPEANVKFTYGGLAADYYADNRSVPRDGSLYIVLNSDFSANFDATGAAGTGGMDGQLPGTYNGGWVFMNTKQNIANLSFPVLVHEIGHALGLNHSVAPDSVMNCAEAALDHNDALAFNVQDRVNLIHNFPHPETTLFSISGRASGSSPFVQSVVYAVNIMNGETYHKEIDNSLGDFKIALGRAGSYRVFFNGDPRDRYDQASVSSWYVSDGSSTLDPYAGSVVSVSESSPSATGVNFSVSAAPTEFNLFDAALGTTDFVTWDDFWFSQLRPGHSGNFQLASYGHSTVAWVESYGEKPDYEFTFTRPAGFAPLITVRACANAPQGSRLIIAKGGSTVQAGLIGIHVIGSSLPSVVQAPPLDARNPSGPTAEENFLQNQLNVNFDYSNFDPDYWKN